MGQQATTRLPGAIRERDEEGGSGAFLKVAAVLLGLLVGVLGMVSVLMWADARGDGSPAAPAATQTMPGMTAAPATGAGTQATGSFAGIAPANAPALAAAHAAFPAALAAAPAGPVAKVTLSMQHGVVSIAPGIRYDAWTFGDSAPGPAIHVRQGQTVQVTLRNDAPMPHSVDFHAAQVAPNVDFADVQPGQSKTFSFVASTPGVFMYHCGTAPAFVHIANGMYGAIVVEPKNLPPAQREYVLVASEWYLNGPGTAQPAALDMTKALQMTPDWVTWNGYAAQYKDHPLTAAAGDTVRFWVVDAGPSLNTDFHVVGTILRRAWLNSDLVDAPQHDVQTAVVPAGGGGVFDVQIDKPGLYPFVSHSFASVQMGQVGVLAVGGVHGTMSH